MGMLRPDTPAILDRALCKSCGYPLRELQANRCPECGRPFDPADASTMNLGPRGAIVRRLLRPTGSAAMVLCFIAALLLVSISRVPTMYPGLVGTMFVREMAYYLHRFGFGDRVASITDLIYVLGIAIFALSIAWMVMRALARFLLNRGWGKMEVDKSTSSVCSPDRKADPGLAIQMGNQTVEKSDVACAPSLCTALRQQDS